MAWKGKEGGGVRGEGKRGEREGRESGKVCPFILNYDSPIENPDYAHVALPAIRLQQLSFLSPIPRTTIRKGLKFCGKTGGRSL